MPNRIKDIFSDEMYNINGTLHFNGEEAYKNFLAALEIAQSEGRVVSVDGVTSVATAVNHQGVKFPLEEHANISKFYVGPAIEPVQISLDVDGQEKTITLFRSQIRDKVFLRSTPDSVVAFDFEFILRENRQTIKYKVDFDKAQNINEVANSFCVAAALLDYFYKQDDKLPSERDRFSLSDIKEYFNCYKSFFRRLNTIEDNLSISIQPSLLKDMTVEEQQDIDELYLLLYEKKVLRINTKITSTDSIYMTNEAVEMQCGIGSKIALTFTSTIEFNFLDQHVILYSANLVVNALIKDIQRKDDGAIKVYYSDTDSKPMYIAFSAFTTEDAARIEASSILQHDQKYIESKTRKELIAQLYPQKNKQV